MIIPEGDAQAAAEFTAMRDSQKREDTLDLSDGGKAALEKNMEAKETYSRQEQIKKKIAELEKELAEINGQNTDPQTEQSRKANAVMQQIALLNMQLVQLQKNDSDSGTV